MKRILVVFFMLLSVVSFSNYYYGNIHSHTSYSDGTADPATAYDHAKDSGKLDILAITDHARDLVFPTYKQEDKVVQTQVEATKISDDTFLGFRGFEWTKTGTGHITVYDTGYDFMDVNRADLIGIYQWIILHNGIGNFCHPNAKWGTFNDFDYYPLADEYMSMIEAGNYAGSLSTNMIREAYFNSYIRALEKGWHVAPIASQDNHEATWGTANDARTVFIMDDLTESSIYEAIRNRRVYASEDANAEVKLYTDDGFMGDIFYDATSTILKVEYSDPGEAIDSLYLYTSDGFDIYRPDGDTFYLEIPVSTEKAYEWYFVKFNQNDGDEIVTAPIWLQSSENQYLFTPATVVKNPIKGKPFTVTCDLVNLNYKEKKFVVSILNNAGEELISTESDVEAYSKKNVAIELNSNSELLYFYVNGVFASKLPVSFKSFSLKVDTSHENNFRPILTTMENFAKEKSGEYARVRMINEANLANADILVIPFPDADSFMPKYGVLSNEEIDLLSGKIGEGLRVILIFNSSKGTIPSVAESFNNLLRRNNAEYLLAEDGKNLIENKEKMGDKKIEIISFDGKSYEEILSGITLE